MMREMRRKHLVQLRTNCASPEKDKEGSATNSLVGTLRFLAVADYLLEKDVAAFRSGLTEAAGLRMQLLDRFDAGEPISPSYVSMLTYKAIFNALASGNEPLSKALALKMGGREAIECEYDRPFDVAFGYALKNVLEEDAAAAARRVTALELLCKESENADFRGYATVLRAILDQNAEVAMSGIAEVVAGHKRQSKGGGLFKDSEDEQLSVWGIGLVNLARMRGLKVGSSDPLIPTDLLA
jgi:hypothetical protein